MIVCKIEEVDFAPVAFPTPNPASTGWTTFSSPTSTSATSQTSYLQNVCYKQYISCLGDLQPPKDRKELPKCIKKKNKCVIAQKDCLSAGKTTLQPTITTKNKNAMSVVTTSIYKPTMQIPSSLLQTSTAFLTTIWPQTNEWPLETTSQAMNSTILHPQANNSTVNSTSSNNFDVVLFIGRETIIVNNSCFSTRIFAYILIFMF